MIKRLFASVFLITFLINGYSQIDSLARTDEKYDSLYKQQIRNRENQINHLWKLNLVESGVILPTITYETRIGNNWSSETSFGLGIHQENDYYGLDGQWKFSQHLKYYYNQNRREKMGKYTNGFNGNYIALTVGAGELRDPKPAYHSGTAIDATLYAGMGLTFGLQRRIGNSGYFEPYFGLMYQFRRFSEYETRAPLLNFNDDGYLNRWMLVAEIGIKAGLSFESPADLKLAKVYNEKPEKTNYVFKLNLIDIEPLLPNFGFEFRLLKNITSDTYLKFGLPFKMSRNPNDGFADVPASYFYEYEIEQQFKFYYNFRKRENSGKRVTGFSGNYFALNFFAKSDGYLYERVFSAHTFDDVLIMDSYGITAKYGLQRRLGDIAFFDLFAGIKIQKKQIPEQVLLNPEIGRPVTIISTRGEVTPVLGIRAGFSLDRINAGSLFNKQAR